MTKPIATNKVGTSPPMQPPAKPEFFEFKYDLKNTAAWIEYCRLQLEYHSKVIDLRREELRHG